MLAAARRTDRRARHISTARIIALAMCAALVIYPLVPVPARQIVFNLIAWAVVIPVAAGLRASPPALHMPWRLLLVAMVAGAASATLRLLTLADDGWLAVLLPFVPVVSNLLLFSAAVTVIIRRGRNDFGGLIDATLAALALGGLLWSIVVFPQAQAAGRTAVATAILASLTMILSGTAGALLRLIETDHSANRALRLLLAAVALNLAGFVMIAALPDRPANVIRIMLFIGAYAALALASTDPSLADLAQPARAQPDRLSGPRLAFLGGALLAAPAVAGIRILQGRAASGGFLIITTAVMVVLVMLRVGLLARQLHRSEAELRHLATHDPLTGALNRLGFTEILDAELRTLRDCVLIFCDLNDFKQVNDRYGHATGDQLLTAAANRLRGCVRQQDALCRLGGDEFVILARGASTADVLAIRQRIISALKPPFVLTPGSVTISVSIGAIASEANNRGNLTASDLIRQADAAMYADKRLLGTRSTGARPETLPRVQQIPLP